MEPANQQGCDGTKQGLKLNIILCHILYLSLSLFRFNSLSSKIVSRLAFLSLPLSPLEDLLLNFTEAFWEHG